MNTRKTEDVHSMKNAYVKVTGQILEIFLFQILVYTQPSVWLDVVSDVTAKRFWVSTTINLKYGNCTIELIYSALQARRCGICSAPTTLMPLQC